MGAAHPGRSIYCDDGAPTASSKEQAATERRVLKMYQKFILHPELVDCLRLDREQHLGYCLSSLHPTELPGGFACLDASRPWMCYWLFHAVDLLGAGAAGDVSAAAHCAQFVSRCTHPDGGIGGGPGQLGHLASTYAGCLAVCATAASGMAAGADPLAVLKSAVTPAWVRSLYDTEAGSFAMHDDGETDVRATYCALVAMRLAGVDPARDAGIDPAVALGFIARCQTHEGGFSAVPGCEAHGGYTFCAVAAAVILVDMINEAGGAEVRGGIDTRRLKRWLSARQIGAEGGFNGRTCKLVDACYAFWQGGTYACLPALEQGLARNAAAQQQPGPAPAHPAAQAALVATPDRAALQQYLLAACQASDGGMRDKPGKSPDFYHTCYALSGLAIVQHGTYALGPWVAAHGAGAGGVVGDPANALERINPVFNLSERAVAYWRENVLS